MDIAASGIHICAIPLDIDIASCGLNFADIADNVHNDLGESQYIALHFPIDQDSISTNGDRSTRVANTVNSDVAPGFHRSAKPICHAASSSSNNAAKCGFSSM
ncbi:hypothetical protein D3C73_1337190 [compost metagenome]